jgi:hypothetical protein
VDAAWHVPAADPVGELDGHDVVAGGGDGAADVQLAERAARLNMAEVFFSIITRQAIGRGSFTSVRTSSPPSRTSSTAGTTAATPSPGPRPSARYSPNAAQVKEPRSHDTSYGQNGNPAIVI